MDVFPWCFVVYLKTQGISPNEHPVKPELVRDLLFICFGGDGGGC